MKKWFVLLLAVLLCLAFVGCDKSAQNADVPDSPNVKTPCVMYQGVLYYTTGKLVLDVDVDENAIIGEISSVVSGSALPTKDGEANFGQVGMPYALVSEGLAVRIDNAWYLYTKGYEAG